MQFFPKRALLTTLISWQIFLREFTHPFQSSFLHPPPFLPAVHALCSFFTCNWICIPNSCYLFHIYFPVSTSQLVVLLHHPKSHSSHLGRHWEVVVSTRLLVALQCHCPAPCEIYASSNLLWMHITSTQHCTLNYRINLSNHLSTYLTCCIYSYMFAASALHHMLLYLQ